MKCRPCLPTTLFLTQTFHSMLQHLMTFNDIIPLWKQKIFSMTDKLPATMTDNDRQWQTMICHLYWLANIKEPRYHTNCPHIHIQDKTITVMVGSTSALQSQQWCCKYGVHNNKNTWIYHKLYQCLFPIPWSHCIPRGISHHWRHSLEREDDGEHWADHLAMMGCCFHYWGRKSMMQLSMLYFLFYDILWYNNVILWCVWHAMQS